MSFRVIEHETGEVVFKCEDVQRMFEYIEHHLPWEPKELSIIALEKD